MKDEELLEIIETGLKKPPLYLNHGAARWAARNVLATFRENGIACVQWEKPVKPQRRASDASPEVKL